MMRTWFTAPCFTVKLGVEPEVYPVEEAVILPLPTGLSGVYTTEAPVADVEKRAAAKTFAGVLDPDQVVLLGASDT